MPEGLAISIAPAAASVDAGGPSTQQSSQIVRPTVASPTSITVGSPAGMK